MENKEQKAMGENKSTKLVTKILSIVLMVIFCATAIVTTVFAIAPKNYNINLNAPDAVKLHTNGTTFDGAKFYKGGNDGVYDKIMTLYNDGFKTTMLHALFKGQLSTEPTIKEGYQSIDSLNGVYVEFIYYTNNAQTISLNGVEYKPTNSGYDKTYVSVMVQVNSIDTFSEMNAYIKYGGTSAKDYSRIRFTTLANHYQLHKYLVNM